MSGLHPRSPKWRKTGAFGGDFPTGSKCSSGIKRAQINCSRRKISCVRDFPPNCGKIAANPGSTKDGGAQLLAREKETNLRGKKPAFEDHRSRNAIFKTSELERKRSSHVESAQEESQQTTGILEEEPSGSYSICITGERYAHPLQPAAGFGDDCSLVRRGVLETLQHFRSLCKELWQEEAKTKKQGQVHRRVDYEAANILKAKRGYINAGSQIMGNVPGIEVGDEFEYMVELNIVGLHRQTQGGIDYLRQGGKVLATSVVAGGSYDDRRCSSDVIVYTGQGGNIMRQGKKAVDQKLERGNLALANSMVAQNPVRVILGRSKPYDQRGKDYIYDGLYLVEKYWQERGSHGKLVFKFKLVKMRDQKGNMFLAL